MSEVEAGARIGRYEVIARMGRGTRGDLYAARDPELDRRVAIEIVSGTSQAVVPSARCSHANVVPVFDVGAASNNAWVAMELVEGPSLAEWIAAEPRPWGAITEHFVAAGRGLVALHREGLCHGGFATSEVVLSGGRTARVRGFCTLGPPDTDTSAFAAALREALARAVPPPPAWLRAIVERLASAGSLERELDAIERGLRRNGRRRVAVVAALAIATVAGAAILALPASQDACAGVETERIRVWNAARREVVRIAFLATGKPYAPIAFDGAVAALDTYADRWVAVRGETCQAARRAQRSPELQDATVACLDGRLAELDALVGVLSSANAQAVSNAFEASHSLSSIEECGRADLLTTGPRPPQDASVRQRVKQLRARLAEIKAKANTGAFETVLPDLVQSVTAARAIAYRPLEAEALYMHGFVQSRAGRHVDAEKTLRDAVIAAEAGGDHALKTKVLAQLVETVGYAQARYKDGHELASLAAAAAERASNDTMLAHLENQRGIVWQAEGRYAEALASFQRAQALWKKTLAADDPDHASAVMNMGNVYKDMGRYDDAVAAYRQVLAIWEKTLGPHHSSTAAAHDNLGVTLQALGRYEDALVEYKLALDIRTRSLGRDHNETATSHNNLAALFIPLERLDEALFHAREGRAIFERTLGPEHPHVGFPMMNEADALLVQGKYDAALVIYARAEALWRKALGDEHPNIGMVLNNSAKALEALGRWREATDRHRAALALREKLVGRDHPDVALSLYNIAGCLLEQRRPGEARPLLERALAIQQPLGKEHPDLVRTRELLAEVTKRGTR